LVLHSIESAPAFFSVLCAHSHVLFCCEVHKFGSHNWCNLAQSDFKQVVKKDFKNRLPRAIRIQDYLKRKLQQEALWKITPLQGFFWILNIGSPIVATAVLMDSRLGYSYTLAVNGYCKLLTAVILIFSSKINRLALDNVFDFALVLIKNGISIGCIFLEVTNKNVKPSVGILILPILQEIQGQKRFGVKVLATLALLCLITCEAIYGNKEIAAFIGICCPISLLAIFTEETRSSQRKPSGFTKIVKEFFSQAIAEAILGTVSLVLLEPTVTEVMVPVSNRVVAMMFFVVAATTSTVATLTFSPLVLSRFSITSSVGSHLSEGLNNGMTSLTDRLTFAVGLLQIFLTAFTYVDGQAEWTKKMEQKERQRKKKR
jgi:hypothetical protein